MKVVLAGQNLEGPTKESITGILAAGQNLEGATEAQGAEAGDVRLTKKKSTTPKLQKMTLRLNPLQTLLVVLVWNTLMMIKIKEKFSRCIEEP